MDCHLRLAQSHPREPKQDLFNRSWQDGNKPWYEPLTSHIFLSKTWELKHTIKRNDTLSKNTHDNKIDLKTGIFVLHMLVCLSACVRVSNHVFGECVRMFESVVAVHVAITKQPPPFEPFVV